jgi:hypothetical protein
MFLILKKVKGDFSLFEVLEGGLWESYADTGFCALHINMSMLHDKMNESGPQLTGPGRVLLAQTTFPWPSSQV